MRIQVRAKLLKWFDQNGRTFYWREHNDPFTILVSEIFLKKTTAQVVNKYLPEFIRLYPDIDKINRTDKETLIKFLLPLGLSKQRGQQIKELAKVIHDEYNGVLPNRKEKLLRIPGIGEYIAGALLSFAFHKPEPIVDTNVARIIVRVCGIQPSRCEARRSPEIWQVAREWIGKKGQESKIINWSLLDIGALACKAKNPIHDNCPLKRICSYYEKIDGA